MNESQLLERLEKARDDSIKIALSADTLLALHRAQGRVSAFNQAIDWLTKDQPRPRAANKAFS